MSDYSIGQVASAAGLATSAIRYYEKIGLLPPARRSSGRRRYSEGVLSRLAVIQLCKQLGFELSEVKTVLDGLTKGDRSTQRLKRLALNKLAEVEEAIAKARVLRDLLVQAGNCRCPSLQECAARAKQAGVLRC
jgi:MerR family redox-sensitive transcriptional activator SoxR